MTYYVTKYGLTDGIWIVPGDMAEEQSGYLYVGEPRKIRVQVSRADFFKTLKEAEERVEAKRKKKVKALRNQIEKLEQYKAGTRTWPFAP